MYASFGLNKRSETFVLIRCDQQTAQHARRTAKPTKITGNLTITNRKTLIPNGDETRQYISHYIRLKARLYTISYIMITLLCNVLGTTELEPSPMNQPACAMVWSQTIMQIGFSQQNVASFDATHS